MSILPKEIYRFNTILSKHPWLFFIDIEQKILKCGTFWSYKRCQIAKADLRENKAGGVMLPNKIIIIRTVGARKEAERSMKKNTCLRNKPTHIRSINLWQRRQEYTTGRRQVSINGVGNTELMYAKKVKLDHF